MEVTSDIQNIANWILDVVLDQEVNTQEVTLPDGTKAKIVAPEQNIWMNTQKVLECALISKFPNGDVRFGAGRRNNSGSRLSVMDIHFGIASLCMAFIIIGSLGTYFVFELIKTKKNSQFKCISLKLRVLIYIEGVFELLIHLHLQY